MTQEPMTKQLWTAVDLYLADCLFPPDPALDQALQANAAASLPAIDVTAHQGKFLYLLAQIQGARRILEIGTLGGYSTIWLARALPPGGVLVTLEAHSHHAQVAKTNIARAGLSALIELRLGPALDTLAEMFSEGAEPFDFIFIDADKAGYPEYLDWSLKLSRPGTLIVADNVVRDGKVIEPDNPDPNIQGVRRFTDLVAAEPRLSATVLQTVGSKGYDGFALAVVLR